MTKNHKPNNGFIAAALVSSLAVTGFFVGLQSPMINRVDRETTNQRPLPQASSDNSVIPATHYSDLAKTKMGPNSNWKTSLAMLKNPTHEILNDESALNPIVISPQQKTFALALREQSRAFNGAPPTIPHPIDQMSSVTCVACHTDGLQMASLRIPRMSHPFMTNCTQCHVESSPKHMASNEWRENSFVGLPAPTGGPRAYPDAPPQIPHSVWMRNDCLSCHGPSGNFGIRTTHPWRTNCQQCHAPSSKLNQVPLDSNPKFLPPLKIDNQP